MRSLIIKWTLPVCVLTYAFGCLSLTAYLSLHPLQPVEPEFSFAPFHSAIFNPKPYTSPALPDFAAIRDVKQKKAAFFNYLRPAIEYNNQKARDQHKTLQSWRMQLRAKKALDPLTRLGLSQLATRYRLKPSLNTEQQIDALLLRIDELPPSMVLAQAAMESAWGTSRFARKANNLFGQWCFSSGCGIVPLQRSSGDTHEVKLFASVGSAVEAYYLNINTHAAYQGVRNIRAESRAQGTGLKGALMVAGLEKYSGRGMHYVEELRSMIRTNRLE